MPIRKPKPTSPGPALRHLRGLRGGHEDASRRSRSPRASRSPAAATPTGARPPATAAAAPSACTGSSTSSAARTGSPPAWPRSSTTPTASAYIALLHYVDGAKAYILAPNRLRVGMIVESGPTADITVGNALPLANMPVGTVVHNVELQPGRGGQLARSAGAGVQLMAKEGDYATLRLPSGEMRMVRTECRATVGHDRQRRPPEHHRGQGRPQAPHGRAPADARHRHEPGGPPARRRRGRHAAGQPPADALGRADDRLPHPQEGQAVRPLHRPRPSPRQEGQPLMSRSSKKGPWVEDRLMERIEQMNSSGSKTMIRTWSRDLHDLPRDGRPHDRRARRAQARPGVRVRVDGRPQARRVRADAHLPRAARSRARSDEPDDEEEAARTQRAGRARRRGGRRARPPPRPPRPRRGRRAEAARGRGGRRRGEPEAAEANAADARPRRRRRRPRSAADEAGRAERAARREGRAEPEARGAAAEAAADARRRRHAQAAAAKKPARARRAKRDRAPASAGVEFARRPGTCAPPPARRGWSCDHIRGKDVAEARAILAFTPRAAAKDWAKLLESAVANAEHNHELVGEDLRIAAVYADEGPTLKRYRPRAMGRATRIRKRTSPPDDHAHPEGALEHGAEGPSRSHARGLHPRLEVELVQRAPLLGLPDRGRRASATTSRTSWRTPACRTSRSARTRPRSRSTSTRRGPAS